MTVFLVWVHLLAAVAWIGGMLFLSLVIVPALQTRAARVAPKNPVSSHRAAVSDRGLDLGGRAAQYRPGITELER